ncbi:uncharacterized protein LOC141695565 [Apium graveolens]|uniref:uncharacterized protein LOC141695565 n=1 Tax=Apium graveolens TaxID=4045 RepID=UPI003D79D88C
MQNEVENNINVMGGASDNVDPDIVEELLSMLDKNNELVKTFRMARNRFENEDLDEFKLVLISSQSSSGIPNHIMPSDEVAAFILQYPLLFLWGTEGYHKRIPLINIKYPETENLDDEDLDPDSTQRRHISLKEYYCYKIMIRNSEGLTPHLAGHLWQQYVVDYKGDHDPMHVGKAVILPTSFTGSQRYMFQYFKDSLAICRAIVDAPDIVSHVFKLNLDQLLDLIKKKNYFGKCIGVMHVIEFQKRGLPHVHMLIWLSPESRPNSIEKVDQLVPSEILDMNSDPIAYEAVKNYMMHGTCDLMKYLNIQSSADLKDVCNDVTSKKSKLDAWFVANSEFPQARNFTYSDFSTHFTWIKKTAKWKLCQRGDVVERLAKVHATTGELLYLRMLLLRCKGALSFTRLRTIDGTTYDTFKEACGALGLLNNDKQWHDALEENAFSAMPTQIRAMFVNILENCYVSDLLALWEKHWPTLLEDVLYMRRRISYNIHLILSEYEIHNYALAEIEKLLNDVEGKIVLPFIGSGIAATLLPGGRTTHSRFKIPLKLDRSSIAGIKYCIDIAELMQHTSLIIWDEAPMQHRYAFEAVDISLRDIMVTIDVEQGKSPFGGIIVVFGGNFR